MFYDDAKVCHGGGKSRSSLPSVCRCLAVGSASSPFMQPAYLRLSSARNRMHCWVIVNAGVWRASLIWPFSVHPGFTSVLSTRAPAFLALSTVTKCEFANVSKRKEKKKTERKTSGDRFAIERFSHELKNAIIFRLCFFLVSFCNYEIKPLLPCNLTEEGKIYTTRGKSVSFNALCKLLNEVSKRCTFRRWKISIPATELVRNGVYHRRGIYYKVNQLSTEKEKLWSVGGDQWNSCWIYTMFVYNSVHTRQLRYSCLPKIFPSDSFCWNTTCTKLDFCYTTKRTTSRAMTLEQASRINRLNFARYSSIRQTGRKLMKKNNLPVQIDFSQDHESRFRFSIFLSLCFRFLFFSLSLQRKRAFPRLVKLEVFTHSFAFLEYRVYNEVPKSQLVSFKMFPNVSQTTVTVFLYK